MNYESIILELLSRVQNLENEVAELKKDNTISVNKKVSSTNYTENTRRYVNSMKNKAKEDGKNFIILKAGDVEKEMGLSNRIVLIINAMHDVMGANDEILDAPRSGYSTRVRIKYYL